MSTTSLSDTFSNLGLATTGTTSSSTSSTANKSLSQTEFLKLLTTQMTHQDPTKPMDNAQFVSQLAQISTVSGIQDLQASFKDFASSISSDQALQAAGLVGRYITAPSKEALLSAGDTISGDFTLPSSTSTSHIKIINPKTGALIKELDLGAQSAGTVSFEWDGKNTEGNLADPGLYKVEASAMVDGKNTVLATNIKSKVESVTMGSSGIKVDLVGLDSIKFSQIKQIL